MVRRFGRWSVVAVLCLALSTNGFTSTAIADGEVQHRDLFQLLADRHNTSIVNGVAKIWTDSFGDAVSYISVVDQIAGGGAGKGPGTICSTLYDPACDPRTPKIARAKTVLGICESLTEVGCIESVSYKNSDFPLENLTPVSIPPTVRAEDARANLPRGSTMSIWEASNGTRYVVSAVVNSDLRTEKKTWGKATSTASVSIVRVKRDYVVPPGRAEIRTDGSRQSGESRFHVIGGAVGPTLEFEGGSFFKLSVRVPNSVGGFFRGRIANAVVERSASSSSVASTSYVIQGDVSPVYVAGAEANADDPKSPDLGSLVRGYNRTNSLSTYLKDYSEWKHLIGDRALTTRSYWGVISSATHEQRCFESEKKINGLVSSNSAFYPEHPPVFNSSTGTFDYEVASPHFDENGNEAVGNYSLSIPLSTLQCLHGSTVVPGTAEISVIHGNGSPMQTVQQKVTISGDWVNVSVSGFHFSSPVIRAKFAVPYQTKLAKGKSIFLKSISKTKSSQRAKWSTSGPCKISGTKLVALKKSGTCKVTLKVLDSQKKYVVSLRRNFKVS